MLGEETLDGGADLGPDIVAGDPVSGDVAAQRLDQLIHVKRAKGSAPLSHLFSQGLVSAQTLLFGPAHVRQRFAEAVTALGKGRTLPPEFTPKKVVYAILLENGKQLTPDTLFPFSQVTLAHAAKTLGTYGIDVEVAGISSV